MKKVTREVKSEGKVVDTVEVPVYENIPEAVKAQTEEKCLAAINKTISNDICNAARAAKVRPSSANAQLGRLAKTDPEVQKEIEALVAKHLAKMAA